MICSICGTDNMKKYCRHWPGGKYTVEDGTPGGSEKRCLMLLSGAKDAWELSFVPVGAQPRAGTHKSVGFTKPVLETEAKVEDPEVKDQTENNHIDKDLELVALRARESESFIFTEN